MLVDFENFSENSVQPISRWRRMGNIFNVVCGLRLFICLALDGLVVCSIGQYEPRRARLEYFYFLTGGLRPRNLDRNSAAMTASAVSETNFRPPSFNSRF